ncbi:hypothetical protein IG631_15495 [Alternaria alternata]|nr:hypothetical protein IG631_15495 [Alternaria alternata]
MDLLADVPEYRAHLIRCLADYFLLRFYCWPFVAGLGVVRFTCCPALARVCLGAMGL